MVATIAAARQRARSAPSATAISTTAARRDLQCKVRSSSLNYLVHAVLELFIGMLAKSYFADHALFFGYVCLDFGWIFRIRFVAVIGWKVKNDRTSWFSRNSRTE